MIFFQRLMIFLSLTEEFVTFVSQVCSYRERSFSNSQNLLNLYRVFFYQGFCVRNIFFPSLPSFMYSCDFNFSSLSPKCWTINFALSSAFFLLTSSL